eukprot:scaffold42107_cov62-Phaeocystis_antarctica.AAC.1
MSSVARGVNERPDSFLRPCYTPRLPGPLCAQPSLRGSGEVVLIFSERTEQARACRLRRPVLPALERHKPCSQIAAL